jgi:hypothetical protein
MDFKKYLQVNASCIAIIISLLICPSLSIAQESLEHQVKAAFIHKFIMFTSWPSSAFDSNDSPVVIGVLGESPIWSKGFGIQTSHGSTCKNNKSK